jgi:hypothetical protein
MTEARARSWVIRASSVWAASIALSVLGFAAKGRAGFFDFATAITAVAISLGLIVFIAWLISMVAGPAVLIKLRNRPNTLGVWTAIALPLSIAFAFACCVAFPIAKDRGCTNSDCGPRG